MQRKSYSHLEYTMSSSMFSTEKSRVMRKKETIQFFMILRVFQLISFHDKCIMHKHDLYKTIKINFFIPETFF